MTIPKSFLNSNQTGLSLSIYILYDTVICRRQPKKEKKRKSATQRRWLLTQVFYASYLDWTITNLLGEHGAVL